MQFVLIMSHDDAFESGAALVQSIFEWIDLQSAAGVRIVGCESWTR